MDDRQTQVCYMGVVCGPPAPVPKLKCKTSTPEPAAEAERLGYSAAARLNSAGEAAGCDLWRTRYVFELRHNWVKNQQPAADSRQTQMQRQEEQQMEQLSPNKGDKVNSPHPWLVLSLANTALVS